MNDKLKLYRKLTELDFALHELNLFLDTHPESEKALKLLSDFRAMKKSTLEEYESRYGKLVTVPCDTPAEKPWCWIKGPWPWEIDFEEAK